MLLSGSFPDAHNIAWNLISNFESTIDKLRERALDTTYTGLYASEDGKSSTRIVIDLGALWISEYILDGENMLKMFQVNDKKAPLWPAASPNTFQYVS